MCGFLLSFFLSFFLYFLFGVAHAPFACQRWGLPNRLAQCATPGRDYCSVARHHQANLIVCVVCSCCATSLYREVCRANGGIRSGETLCHDIYPARPITTIFYLETNTYYMMDSHSSCATRTVGPWVQFSGACEQSNWWPCKGVRCPPIFSLSNLINAGWLVRKCVNIYIYTSFNCWH